MVGVRQEAIKAPSGQCCALIVRTRGRPERRASINLLTIVKQRHTTDVYLRSRRPETRRTSQLFGGDGALMDNRRQSRRCDHSYRAANEKLLHSLTRQRADGTELTILSSEAGLHHLRSCAPD
jgi:hypothetical protein